MMISGLYFCIFVRKCNQICLLHNNSGSKPCEIQLNIHICEFRNVERSRRRCRPLHIPDTSFWFGFPTHLSHPSIRSGLVKWNQTCLAGFRIEH